MQANGLKVLIFMRTGWVVLFADWYYTGGTFFEAGVLSVSNEGNLGAPSGGLTFDGGTLRTTSSFTIARAITLNAGGGVFAPLAPLTLAGPISGVGGLTQEGPQPLILTGADQYSGATQVAAGQLTVNGTLASSAVLVSAGATLRGTGSIAAPTTVAGTLAPGSSPGTLTIQAPVTMASGAISVFDIDGTGTGTGPGNFSRLVVTAPGSLTAGGQLVPILRGITGLATNSYVPPLGQGFAIVSAAGGVAGSYTGLVQPAGLSPGTRFDALYGPTTVSLFVTPASYANLAMAGIALNTNQSAVGAALDFARPAAGPAMTASQAALYGTLYAVAPGYLGATLTQLSPTIAGDNMLVVRDTTGLVATTIGSELESRRGAASGMQTQAAALPSGGTIWLAGIGQFNNLSTQSAPGYSGSTGGAVVGVDYAPGAGAIAGLALAFANAAAHDTAGARLSTDGLQLTAYGGLRSGLWFTDAQAWGGFFETKTWRVVGAFGTTAQGSTAGSAVGGALRGGMHLETGGWQFEPSLLVGVGAIQQNGFVETQGGPTALGVSAGTLTSVQTLLSAHIEKRFTVNDTMTLVPSIRVGWAHECADTQAGTYATFAAPATTPFLSQTTSIGRDRAVIGVGAPLQINPWTTLFLAYGGAFGDHETSQNATGGVRVTW
jgi:uncharacterized protein with beta-barrel porin domain